MRFQHLARRSAIWSLSASRIPRLLASRLSGIGGILSFHRVCQPPVSAFAWKSQSITPDNFRCIIAMLLERDYEIVTMSGVEERLRTQPSPTRKLACLTFDDGFRDTYEHAFAICKSFGVPMVVYVMTGTMQRAFPMWGLMLEQAIARNDAVELACGGEVQRLPTATPAQQRRAYLILSQRFADAHPQQCREMCEDLAWRNGVSAQKLADEYTLTPEMIREMQASGLVEFGAHSLSHPKLALLNVAEARHEIAESRRELERVLGQEVLHFAYPFGGSDAAGPREFELCRELGFRTVVTSEMGNLFPGHRERLHALPRLTINGEYQGTALPDLLLSGVLPRLMAFVGAWSHGVLVGESDGAAGHSRVAQPPLLERVAAGSADTLPGPN
jgi:peptidoglycan/xylan/chitin deacetylase (PgdA/CDA1 family)